MSLARLSLPIAAAAFALAGGPASAAEIEVRMLNKGSEGPMVFEPALVKAAPGDVVRFVPTDKGHNAETVEGMLPDGTAAVVGKMNEELVLKVEKPGVYGIKCKPHYAMGMVALVVVGEPGPVDGAKAVPHPGKAKSVFAQLFDRAGAAAR